MTADSSSANIIAMVQSSGLVVQLVLFTLIILSIFSWAITISKILQFRKARASSKRFAKIFWDLKNFTKVAEKSDGLGDSPLVKVFFTGYKELLNILDEEKSPKRNEDDGGGESTNASSLGFNNDKSAKLSLLESSMDRSQYEEGLRLERGLTFLASVSTAAPFIGLFGTVWGIMNAFHGLSTSTNTSIQAVAPGISEALIATAIGLAAAIPAAVAYNYFAVGVKNFRENMNKFSNEFVSIAEKYFVK